MLEAPHFSPAGNRRDAAFALPGEYFDGDVNQPVLHQAVKTFLNNQRQGTASTKTRSFVSGGNQKPWKQKGTGRARQGSIRAPHWRGGGIVFGPHPRDYRSDIPKKVRQLARRSALNARASEGSMFVVEQLQFDAPKTARLVELLHRLGVAERKVLLLTNGNNGNVFLSGRNIADLRIMNYQEASAYDVLWAEVVVAEQGAITGEVPTVSEDASSLDTRTPRAKREPASARTKKKAARAARAEAEAAPVAKKKTAKAKVKAKAPAKKAKAKKAGKTTAKKPAAKKAPKKKGGK
ncbi:MAG TPA: 50S ribosomal protein L4 [Gemmatimonadales bacterium]|jgi:large subunit ribosomal protein L4|nr:50S ribosomal protein L4 [Gemmatimonadales bacterium]